MFRTKIIFDNDGVNVDGEDIAMRVMDDWGSALVRRFRPDADLPKDYIFLTYPGTSTDEIIKALIDKFNLPVELIIKDYNLAGDADVPVALADLITLETNERFKTELKSIPHVTQALTEIRQMFGAENVALATTSRADRMDISLAYAVDPVTGENARLDEMFPKGSRRRSGYGHVNKYDEAFTVLAWDPAATIIVEDSLSGVSKAMKGRPDIAVIGTVAARFYEDKQLQATALLDNGALLVISSMADLPKAATWVKTGMPVQMRPVFEAMVFTKPLMALPLPRPNLGLIY